MSRDITIVNTNAATFCIQSPPKPVGYWVIGSGGYQCMQFAMYVQPTPEHIKNHKEMLGWDWVKN